MDLPNTLTEATESPVGCAISALVLEACDDPHCEGIVIQVRDLRLLARAVALVLMQQTRAARRVLAGEEGSEARVRSQDIERVIAKRLVEPTTVHRDGLLFQIVTWLASTIDASEHDVLGRPHVLPAAKGIDAGIVHLGPDNELLGVSICEDKATGSPRNKIQQRIWPDIQRCETGDRDDELRTFLVDTLIRRQVCEDLAEQAAAEVIWEGKRQYRVRVTVGQAHREPPNRGDLFQGFDGVAPGTTSRRRGETMYVEALRPWFASLAQGVISELRSLV